MKILLTSALTALCWAIAAAAANTLAANPVVSGQYADPEVRIFDNQFWIYPTYSASETTPDQPVNLSDTQREMRRKPDIWSPFLKQTFLDAFSSPDLVNWTKHPRILEVENVSWAAYAIWAPSAIKANGQYYLFFGANDIKNNNELGGIGVAISDSPEGPYRDALGKPLIGQIHNGAQPIDQMVFQDDDGQFYMYYGGWKHCNVVKLSDDLLSLEAFDNGELYKEITPSEHYVEGSFMVKRKGIYYLMWSEGEWAGPDYRVAYAMSSSPTGPFERGGKILQQDNRIARGAGHHSVVKLPGTDDWYIVYHRRPLGSDDGNHRVIAIEKMLFNDDGTIKPVVMTDEGVSPVRLP